jgi:hypothetical protein
MSWLNDQRGATSIGLAITLTVVMAAMMGGTLHYSLKKQEERRVTQLVAQAQEAGEQKVVAVSRAFAWLGGGLVQTDLFRIQELLQTGFLQEGLVDAVVLDPDNMVVAAKNSAQIGQHVQDIAWLSLRAQNKEAVSRTSDQAGRLLVTVSEPMKEKDETVAWAKMTYSVSSPAVSLRTPAERLKETGTLIGPLALLLFIGIFAALRWVEQTRQESSDDVDSSPADEEESRSASVKRLRKVS